MEVSPPAGDGVVVKVASAGICGSDLHLLAFPLTTTLGHEFAGWLPDGTPVAVEPIAPCGHCPMCLDGDYQRCAGGMATMIGVGRDGGMAESCLVPASAIVRLAAGVEPRDACVVEPLAVAVHAIRRGRITAADRVAVIGGGTIGLCAVAAARACGAHVDLVARHYHQRAAGERLGAGTAASDGYDVVIDAAGTTEAFDQCVSMVRARGRIVMVGTYWGGLQVPGVFVCLKEIDIIPSSAYGRSGPARDIDIAATLLAATPEIATTLITHRLPLDAAIEAFALAQDRSSGAIKVVLEP
jgi:2-desacetyl-2-hydroxyethyl bacteriochlorophyllide A dehydrogenase